MIDFQRFPEGATALIVGASGGIGRAIADQLEQHPRFARVIRTARQPSTLVGRGPRLALDLCSDASIEALAGSVIGEHASLHLVIMCAGLLHDESTGMAPEKRLQDLDRHQLQRSFDVNAVGPLLLARALAPALPRRDHAVWANLSARVGSIQDNRLGGWYAYRAAKAAQNMFTRTVAIELARRHRGLACVALHPGTVATDLSSPFRSADAQGVFPPELAASHLLRVVADLDASATGSFLAWDGTTVSW